MGFSILRKKTFGTLVVSCKEIIFRIMLNKKSHTLVLLGLIITLLLTLMSCSKEKDEFENATHILHVTPIPFGEIRMDNIKIFISEAPFDTWDKFHPLTSIDFPKNRKLDAPPLKINMSAYVGKTVYVSALRKHLLSDNYYNISPEAHSTKKLTITAEETAPEITFTLATPPANTYTPDKATLNLTVKKGSTIATNTKVYYHTAALWSDALAKTLEERYMIDVTMNEPEPLKSHFVSTTNASGTLRVQLIVDEEGAINNTDPNEHIFFVIDNGKIKPTKVKVNSLNMNATLTY